jgi:hypothetical protein
MFVKVNMVNHALHVCLCWIDLCLINSTPLNLAYASRVELPDGNYSLVSEAEEGGSDTELHLVEVNQDTEEP